MALLHAAPVGAADTTWTGSAPAPFWDLAANWSAGPPLSGTTGAQLLAFDTTLRSGLFEAGSVQGSGTFTVTGGELLLHGDASVGRLDFRGGLVHGAANITLGELVWSGGAFGRPYAFTSPNITVNGSAQLAGTTLYVGDSSGSLVLNGKTVWADGNSTLSGEARIYVAGEFIDHAGSGNHAFSDYSSLIVDGSYTKTGVATTVQPVSNEGSFVNRGMFTVKEGAFEFRGVPGGVWANQGTITVQAGSLGVYGFRTSLSNSGKVDVSGGRMVVALSGDSILDSTGEWRIAPGATLSFDGDGGEGGGQPSAARFHGGTIRNEGRLTFSGGSSSFAPTTTIQGPGAVEVLRGAQLDFGSSLTVGALRIAEPLAITDYSGQVLGFAFGAVRIDGSLTTGRLDWAEGSLAVSSGVLVQGPATLTENPEKELYSYVTPGKVIDTAFRFNGGVLWDGNGDIRGKGSVAVATGTTFEDRNTLGALGYGPSGSPERRPTRISVASFDNGGTYLKTGAGETIVASAFRNTGAVRLVDAAPMTFTGSLDNSGTLEAVRSRIVIAGSLSQLGDGRLQGGRYVMRDGVIVLQSAGGPSLIRTNRAEIVLDGPTARLVTDAGGTDVGALSVLQTNEGTLVLAHAAQLQTSAALFNRGTLEISGGSVLRLGDGEAFEQSTHGCAGCAAQTWLDGTLQASGITFVDGVLGPGGRGAIGTARLLSPMLSLGADASLLLDIDSGSMHDVLMTPSRVSLGGTLELDFDGSSTLGRYRVLVADGGVLGKFDALASNLDPARYHVSLDYGSTFVDVNVSAVPEPGGPLLWAVGIAMLAVGRARRNSDKCRKGRVSAANRGPHS